MQAGDWLDDHDVGGHALVLPASGFAEYYWGRPLDDPLQALTSTSWAHGLVDNPAGQAIRKGELVRFLPYSELYR